ncbi:MAG: tetratricopeptide repeat protein [Spirochaetes bacterium]|nr:tetratricopeptide repeat protein [Spirochaetota bacterium]
MTSLNKKTILGLAIIVAFLFANNENSISAQDVSHESDIQYILMRYHILQDYEGVLRLLHRYHFDRQNELAYLFGLTYLRLNMNRIALDYLRIALANNENNHEILNNIGVAYFQSNDFLNAMKYFHLSFISNPDFEIARKNYNVAHERWFSQREDVIIGRIIPFTGRPTLYTSVGWFYYYLGNFHNAIFYFRKAIEEDERFQFAYIALAYIYHEGNNFKTALHYLLLARQINDNIPDLHNNLGIVYYHLSDFENSEIAFRRAISLNRRFAEPHNNLGFLFITKGEYNLSQKYFEKSIELNLVNFPLRATSFAGLAIISMIGNNIEQARIYKEASIRLDFRMSNLNYLINTLKWSNRLIEIWSRI